LEKLFINRVILNKDNIDNSHYPFNIKCLMDFEELEIDNSVTLFYGENGVGKSTLIEAIAIALGLNPEGGSNNMQFSNYDDYSDLYKYLTISKFGVPKTKFF
jgi:predicted ATPase